MKTTKILLGALRVSALIALFAIAMPAKAQTLNVNFNGNGATYTGLGAASDSGTYWNSVQYGMIYSATRPSYPGGAYGQTATGFKDSDGVPVSGVTLEVYSPTGFSPYDGTPGVQPTLATPLLGDEFFGGTTTIALSGLTAGGKYDLYLYSQNGNYNSNIDTFTFGTSQTVTNNPTGDATFTSGVNYAEFVLTADVSGDITGTTSSTINGFQLEAVPPPAAPEPSTYALMGLGALALLVVSRRRRTA